MRRLDSFVPNWWKLYAAGGLKTPQSLYRSALSEFHSDPPSTSGARFAGDDIDVRGSSVGRLIWSEGLRSEAYLQLLAKVDWRWAAPEARAFAGRVLCRAADWQVPLYVTDLRFEDERARHSLSIVHARYGHLLLRDEWLWLARLAGSVAPATGPKLSFSRGIDAGDDPSRFYIDGPWLCADFGSDPLRLSPRQLARYSS